jgi:hypothetical protein
MLIWLVFVFWQTSPTNPKLVAGNLLLFILLVLLGWKVFGPLIHS